jgi:O-antigen ligase
MMEQSSNEAILASSSSQRFKESLSRIRLPFENLLVAWFVLSPLASFFIRFPLEKSVLTFDRAVIFGLVLMLLLKFWQRRVVKNSPQHNTDAQIQNANSEVQAATCDLQTANSPSRNSPSESRNAGLFFASKFEIVWLFLSAIALLNALAQSTNVAYAIKIAIDAFFLPLIIFHIAKHHFDWRKHKNILTISAMALALFLFVTGFYEFFTGTNLFAYKGSSVVREGELRVNGAFASDSSFAIICLLLTLFLRLLPTLFKIKFDKSAKFVYFCVVALAAVATLLPLFRTVGFAMLLCWLAIEYFIHTKRKLRVSGTSYFKLLRSRRVMIFSASALILLVSFVVWTEVSGSYLIRRLASPRNLYGRLATWQTAARIAFENPVAGVGLTNYSEHFDVIFSDWQHQEINWIGDIRAVDTPHSNFLWIASELGLSGFAPYLLANFYLLGMGCRALRCAKTQQQFLASGGFLALFAAYTIPGFTLQSGLYADLNLYFFFMLGLLANIFSEPQP